MYLKTQKVYLSKGNNNMAMKYYLYILGDEKGSLMRADLDSNPIVLDRRDHNTRSWVFTPSMISITGLGSDDYAYNEISKQKADKIIKKEEPRKSEGSPVEDGG